MTREELAIELMGWVKSSISDRWGKAKKKTRIVHAKALAGAASLDIGYQVPMEMMIDAMADAGFERDEKAYYFIDFDCRAWRLISINKPRNADEC